MFNFDNNYLKRYYEWNVIFRVNIIKMRLIEVKFRGVKKLDREIWILNVVLFNLSNF